VLLAHMLLKLVSTRIAFPSSRAAAFVAPSHATMIGPGDATFCADVAVTVSFATERGCAEVSEGSARFGVDEAVCKVGTCQSKALACIDKLDRLAAEAKGDSEVLPAIAGYNWALPIVPGDSDALSIIVDNVGRRIVIG
jgi:hypothetical protein